jgi:hypothetical protein
MVRGFNTVQTGIERKTTSNGVTEARRARLLDNPREDEDPPDGNAHAERQPEDDDRDHPSP